MKISTNTDFTKLPRAVSVVRAAGQGAALLGSALLAHDERHLRRRVISLVAGDKVLVDLDAPVALADGDHLVLEDSRHVEIRAAAEEVLSIRGRDPVHLTELAWHIGNRHLAAQVEADRIVILRDHVIEAMLEGLGASAAATTEPFTPLGGAYGDQHHGHDHGHGHGAHDHGHGHHDHHHDHGHGGRDAFGRLPGDPHYGHNHG